MVLSRAARVLVLSDSDGEEIVTARLADPARLRRIHPVFRVPTPMDKSAAKKSFGIDPTDIVILWVGRFGQEKDPMTFIRSLEKLTHHAGVVALMVGDGPLMPAVSEFSRRSNMRNVILTGWLSDLDAAYAAADLYVSTSRWEGFAITVLEAAGSGLPLIISNCPGNTDVIEEGVPALLFEPGDEYQLVDKLRLSLAELSLRMKLGQDARHEMLRRHNPDELAHKMLAIYDELTA